jgi:hypothetical protein
MFFIGASFLVLHHIREHDWRQPFMGLPLLVRELFK